ncbi:MAG: M13 family metallopeptidase, partial [Treponema sp.]|nr:M13 family metallopeptidase [Treponema sp.]
TGKIADEKMAVNTVRAMLATPLNRAYLARNDLSGLKKKIEEICKSCVSIYRQMLTEEDWLSEATKKKAIEKLDNLRIHAIYPEKWIDYSGLKLKGLSLVECLKAMYAFNRKMDVSHTNGKVDKELWTNENLLIANAFYYPEENSINIIPGLLEKPFYYEGMSQEALLGGIGAVIGHEISHAFDTNGAQFDKDGNLANWWTKADFTAFRKRAAKLVAYYDQIVSWQGLTIKGEVIQTEAIADMAGIKAMLKYAETIPNFNHKEFFESYACICRMLRTPEFDEAFTFEDPHPKNYLRTNVTLQQFEEFYKVYDVKAGDNMYLAPEKRILVW